MLQAVRDSKNKEENEKAWQNWVLFNLKGIETTAQNTIILVKGIQQLMMEYKQILRPLFGNRQYKYELLNNLFFHPYTKIEFMEKDMQVQRKSAAKYLNMIEKTGLLQKTKIGRTNYYSNVKLINLFLNHRTETASLVESIESVHENGKTGTR